MWSTATTETPSLWRVTAVLALAGIVVFCSLFVVFIYGYTGAIDYSKLQFSTAITDRNGELLNVLLAEDDRYRLPTSVEDVDPAYLKLLKAYEDRRFDEHHGVDWLALLRASWQLVTNGRVVSGASTLTMQAVKLLEPKPRTVWNKLDQMRKALALERRHSKEEVLHMYLSLAPFGGNIESVKMAALRWFGKSAVQLSPAESALLVALPQSPERRRPDRHAEHARQARTRILERAVSARLIDQEYLEAAALSPGLPQPGGGDEESQRGTAAGAGAAGSAQGEGRALAQLKAKGYADKYRDRGMPIYLLGVEFSKEQSQVVAFEVEEALPLTLDEALEVLTLLQTGKRDMVPVVLLDAPGGSYWSTLDSFIHEELLKGGMIAEEDRHLYLVTSDCQEAVDEVIEFFHVFHSMRFVGDQLVLRLKKELTEQQLAELTSGFGDILKSGDFEQRGPFEAESNEPELDHLSRLAFHFNRRSHGRLRMMIDQINGRSKGS